MLIFIHFPYPTGINTLAEKVISFLDLWLEIRAQQLASTMKDPSFSEEREWRLISGSPNLSKPTGYRVRGSLLVPYQVFDLRINGLLDNVVTGVTVGPTAHSDLALGSLSTFQSTVLKDTTLNLQTSIVPYRTL
jgi:hypothetical protein